MEVLPDNDRWAKEWTGNYAETFLVLSKGTDINRFNEKIGGDYLGSKNELLGNSTLFAQRYSAKYLYGQYENGVPVGGRIAYVKLFSIVALFILLIACVNFMNLSTAKASLKMKEIGVKRTIGATRKALAAQFLGESILMAFLSLLVAVLLVVLLLPAFNGITGKHLHLNPGTGDMLAFAGIVLFTGLLSGSYPAFYLSGFKPIAVLKGKLPTATGDIWLRKGLVVFQFALSVIFIVGLLVVNGQIKYTQTKNLGYDRDNILSFQWKGELYTQWDRMPEGKSNARFETFMLGIKDVPGVVNATSMPGNILDEIYGQSGASWRGREEDKNYIFHSPMVGYDFIEMLGIEMIAGRSFSREYNDDYSKIILNEAAVKLMELENPVGTTIQMNGEDQIIGVVKDFHYGSLHNAIEPLIFRFYEGRNVMVKIEAGTEMTTIARLKEYYHTFLPEYAFEFAFMDEDYQAQYVAETRVAALSKYFTAIAIIVSCLGLFGLAAFTAERRTKEIGIRKVLGASEWKIMKLLSDDFARMVLVAIVIALPISFYITKNWLDGFAYRIDLEWWYFIGAGLLTMLIALLTVSFQSVKAALANPVVSLRSE